MTGLNKQLLTALSCAICTVQGWRIASMAAAQRQARRQQRAACCCVVMAAALLLAAADLPTAAAHGISMLRSYSGHPT